jgi:hypothetical protein
VNGRAVALALVLAAAPADAADLHGAAFYALLAAVPAVALAGLSSFGRVLDGAKDEVQILQALLWGVLLVLVVVGCAARSHALGAPGVPPFASSTLVAALGIVCIKAVLATGARLRGRPRRRQAVVYSSSSRAS